MLFPDRLVVVRGGGDLATGVVYRLRRAGFPVVVCELAAPLTVRRAVALSTAVDDGEVVVDGVVGRRVALADALPVAATGVVPVVVSPERPALPASVVVDARMAKRRLDTTIADAPFVVAIGPGFVAGVDCHAVIETMRGPDLGRVLWAGAALADTGRPEMLGGHGADRVLRAPADGTVRWVRAIGDVVGSGDVLGAVDGAPVTAPFAGRVRGLIATGTAVTGGLKIGDVDPRPAVAWEHISDKALAIGGGVVEAVLTWLDDAS